MQRIKVEGGLMKLRNKKTGEIKVFALVRTNNDIDDTTLAELNEEWEDYEEPKEDYIRVIESFIHYAEEADDSFYCDKSVKKFVEKLKAWKRLKDKGFRFNAWYGSSKNIDWEITSLENEAYIPRQICDDLDLLFGGEE